jgi:ligand-binding sensor domain-containing protein
MGIAVSLVATNGFATSPAVRFKTWNTENGLPQNSIQAIAETPDGYLWLATRDGVAQFDGLRFKVFQKSNTPELPTNRLGWVTTDDAGRLLPLKSAGARETSRQGSFDPRRLQRASDPRAAILLCCTGRSRR